MGSSPIFTEVIDVTLDSTSLEASLDKLISVYKDKLEKLSNTGLDAGTIGGLNVAAINEDLGTVRTSLQGLTEAFMTSFAAIGEASTASGTTIKDTIGTALAETDAAVKASTKTQLEDLSLLSSGSKEAWDAFAQAAQTALTDGFDPRVRMTADLTNNLFTVIADGGRTAFEALTAQQQDWVLGYEAGLAKVADAVFTSTAETTDAYQQATMKQIQLVNNATREMEADFAKRERDSQFYVAGSDEFQRFQMKMVAEQEEATRLMEADMAKRAKLANDPAIVGTDAWQQAQMKQVAATEAATAQMNTEFNKRGSEYVAVIDRMRAEEEKLGADTLAILNRERAEQVALGNDTVAAINRQRAEEEKLGADIIAILRRERVEQEALGDAIVAIQKRVEAEKKAASGAKPVASSDFFAGQLADLGKVFIEWTLIGDIVGLVTKSIDAMFGTISNGVQYLADLEDRAFALQGVLASNVKFSADQTENLKLAGVAAQNVTKSIQDYSIKYGVSIDVLTRGFKSFVDTGGVSLVRNIDEATAASNLFAVAIKASGKDAEATRAALSEVPKLLDGTITSSSKILETLGLTTTEWKAIVTQAKIHHNLLDVVTERTKEYAAAAEEQANHFTAITKTLGLIYDRTTALMAQEFWPTLKDDLKIIRTFLDDNKVAIDACATAIGDFIKQALALVDVKAMMSTLLGLFQFVAIALVDMAGLVKVLNASLGILALSAKVAMQELVNPNKEFTDTTKENIKQIKALKAELDGVGGDDERKRQAILNPTPGPLASPTPNGDPKKNTQDNAKPPKDAIQELQQQYRDLSEQIKRDADKEKEGIAENLAARNISIQTASRLQIEASDLEYAAQKKLIEIYKQKGAVIAATPAARAKFESGLDTNATKFDDANNKANSAETIKGYTDALKLQDQYNTDAEALVKKSSETQLKDIKDRVKNSFDTVAQGIEKELAIQRSALQSKLAIYGDEYEAAGANAEKQQAALQKMADAELTYELAVKQAATDTASARLKERVDYDKMLSEQRAADLAALASKIQADRTASATNLDVAESTLTLSKAKLANIDADIRASQSDIALAKVRNIGGVELQKLLDAQLKLNAARNKQQQVVNQDKDAVYSAQPLVGPLHDAFTEWKDLFDAFTGNLKDFGSQLASTMNATTYAIGAVATVITNVSKAIEQGGGQGVAAGLGAAGDTASSLGSAFKDGGSIADKLGTSIQGLFKDAGVVGSLFSAASGLVSIITSLFTAAAQRIADNINKAFKDTLASYNNGASTLSATLAAVQQEKQDAIAQLSGVKGGQDQLDKLLPVLDSEIASLVAQQKQIITNFETQLQQLQLHSTVLSQTLTTWNSINQSVKDYINAGGDAAKAAAYISESLLAIKNDAANNLSQGEQTAIQQAITYNNLLVQRQQLTDAYNKSRFETLNADALERRTSGAVSTGQKQKTADQAYKTSLTDLNQQIATAATEVGMYKQIYQIAADTATLKAQSAALDIASLAQQIQSLKDYQTIYNSIYKKQDGSYGTSNGAGTGASGAANGPATSNVTNNTTTLAPGSVVVNVPAGTDGAGIASTIQSELAKQGRYGYGTTFTQN